MFFGEDSFVMRPVEKFFKTFTKKEIADAVKSTEMILALSAESREKVDEVVHKALEAGAVRYREPEAIYMDESRLNKG